MTLYAGEPVRIAVEDPETFAGQPLVEDDVSGVVVDVWNGDFTEQHLESVPMPWSEDDATWVYVWDTTGRDPGTYKARVTVTHVDGLPSWEYKRIRLARDPAP